MPKICTLSCTNFKNSAMERPIDIVKKYRRPLKHKTSHECE